MYMDMKGEKLEFHAPLVPGRQWQATPFCFQPETRNSKPQIRNPEPGTPAGFEPETKPDNLDVQQSWDVLRILEFWILYQECRNSSEWRIFLCGAAGGVHLNPPPELWTLNPKPLTLSSQPWSLTAKSWSPYSKPFTVKQWGGASAPQGYQYILFKRHWQYRSVLRFCEHDTMFLTTQL